MSEALGPDPRYSFKKPPEWDVLVASAEAAIIPDRPKGEQGAAVDALWEVLPNLDIETQERNRYYGLGLVVCKVAKSSFLPADAPGSLIPGAVDTLVAHHMSRGRYAGGLRLGDINGMFLISPTTDANRATYGELSLAEQLTTDTLHVINVTSDTWKEHDKTFCRSKVLHRDLAFRDTERSTLVSAAIAFRIAALKLVERKAEAGILPSMMSESGFAILTSIEELLTDEEIRTVCPPATAAQASQLRLDELNHLSDFIYIDGNNIAQFDKAAMPNPPPPAGIPTHQNRIKCPALYVAGAIPYVASAMPEIVIQSQQRILGGHDNRH